MISSYRFTSQLDEGLILIPERYDPRRSQTHVGIKLSEIASIRKQLIDPKRHAGVEAVLVLDTGDADRGLLLPRRAPSRPSDLGSTKKLVYPGDVLISRLRPYLRQIAYVTTGVTPENVTLACSTEFFVLKPVSTKSIAFLVPWLLSNEVQNLLEVGQEGGHHPRFSEEQLLNLIIPNDIIAGRERDSETVIRALNSNLEAMKLLSIM